MGSASEPSTRLRRRRRKNDRIDAQAIAEAAQRPGMNFVPVKSVEAQSQAMILSVREQLVKQHTQAVNALRGHAVEFGVIAAKGTGHVEALLAHIAADPAIPAPAQEMFAEMGAHIAEVAARIVGLDRKLAALHKANPVSQRLAEVPGIGPISGLSLALTVDGGQFRSGAALRRLARAHAEGALDRRQAAIGRYFARGQ